MSPGKVHRYLASFVASGLARQDLDTRQYALGPLAMRLGLAALSSYQPLRDSMALQRELRDRFDETMVLSVWGTQGPTIVHVDESSQPIIMTMRIGAALPILATASGLAFAAFLPRHFTKPLIKKALKTDDGLNLFARDFAAIDRLVAEVREQGYAFNEGHLMPGVSAVAFPLFDRSTALVAVLAVMGRHERVNPRDGAKMIAFLKKATRNFGR
jgi:DNA-binding IclR family transcriptional regulator